MSGVNSDKTGTIKLTIKGTVDPRTKSSLPPMEK
jgi:hypothetical protein